MAAFCFYIHAEIAVRPGAIARPGNFSSIVSESFAERLIDGDCMMV
jgi:hypothetical protein